ncbi:hypothetical protein TNCV_3177231 [Trichonephila clavipes]|nr:hypothetical protein TNCV_3177231 [Trichonephila clavipes]
MMIPAYNRSGALLSIGGGKSISSKSLTFLPEENTSMPYLGFNPEPTRLKAEGRIHHIVWVTEIFLKNEGFSKNNVRDRFHPPCPVSELETALPEKWVRIPMNFDQDSYLSVLRRMQVVIQAKDDLSPP